MIHFDEFLKEMYDLNSDKTTVAFLLRKKGVYRKVVVNVQNSPKSKLVLNLSNFIIGDTRKRKINGRVDFLKIII